MILGEMRTRTQSSNEYMQKHYSERGCRLRGMLRDAGCSDKEKEGARRALVKDVKSERPPAASLIYGSCGCTLDKIFRYQFIKVNLVTMILVPK